MGDLPSKACFQMNDTHPTIAVAELMRLLIDKQSLDWDHCLGHHHRRSGPFLLLCIT